MDKLSVMRAFCRIVELGSFSRAAADLGVSPALLSRETRLLEQSLGCVLLNRTTRSMSLSDHGRIYYAEARQILGDVAAAEDRVRAGAATVGGRLRVNAPQSFGQAVLASLVPRFLVAHPDVELTLDLDDRVVDMVEGGFDLSIRIRASLPDSGLMVRRLADVPQRLFAAPGYLAARGRPVDPAALNGHDLVAFSLADHGTAWDLAGAEGVSRVPLSPRLVTNSSLFLRELVAAGHGIGALPGFLSDPFEADGRLERVLPGHALPDRHVFAVTAARLSADARTRAFLDFLASELKPG